MLLKYTVDASVVWAFAGRWWTPLGYLDPVWTLRQQVLRDAPGWVAPALVVWTLPFLWIGVSLTLRRAVDAGRSPWWCLLFFVPLVNYATMLWLAAQPSRAGPPGPPRAPRRGTAARGRRPQAPRRAAGRCRRGRSCGVTSLAFRSWRRPASGRSAPASRPRWRRASSDPAWGRPATATSRPAASSSRSRFGRRVAGWDSTSRRSRRPCASGARIAT